MAHFLRAEMPSLGTPRTAMSRLMGNLVMDSYLQPPRPGYGLTVHSLADIRGGNAADRDHMVKVLSVADPGLRRLESPPDGTRAYLCYRLLDMPVEVQALFRFTTLHGFPTVWARVQRGEVSMRVLVLDGQDPSALAEGLRAALQAHKIAVSTEPASDPAAVTRLEKMEATLANARIGSPGGPSQGF